jgi:hypothetical protein
MEIKDGWENTLLVSDVVAKMKIGADYACREDEWKDHVVQLYPTTRHVIDG